MAIKEILSDLGGGILSQIDNLNSKRFFGFLGAGGFVGYTVIAGIVAPVIGVPIVAGLALGYGLLETFWPSKAPKDGGKEGAPE